MSAYLWTIDLTFSSRMHHGGLLRYINLSRELVAQGHSVTFAVCFEDDRERGKEWMESLRADGVCTNYYDLDLPAATPRWGRLASMLLPFGLQNLAIRQFLRESTSAMKAALERFPADLVIVSSRQLIFTAHSLKLRPCIGDFSDSLTLYFWRELSHSVRLRQWRVSVQNFQGLFHCFFQELYRPQIRREPGGVPRRQARIRSYGEAGEERLHHERRSPGLPRRAQDSGPAGFFGRDGFPSQLRGSQLVSG